MRDLGLHRLKDFPEPQRLHQVSSAILASDFPPLRAPSASTGNLPVPRTSFVGRQRELSDVRRELAEHRLVTVVGAGGVGKTRLAVEVGRSAWSEFRDGVWLAELAALTEPAEVPRTVLASLGLTGAPDHTALDVVADNLADQELLLVLDNCEHLLAEVGRVVDALLRRCPQLRVLATSREALGVSGERAWRLPSMSLPPALVSGAPVALDELSGHAAVDLFVRRAQQARPDFALTEQTADDVVSVCQRLDGIPLALELAAARLDTMSLTALSNRLADRFAVLDAGPRDSLSRQQTLRALIDWSHDLLDESEREALRSLSVFVEGFSAEAAAALLLDVPGGAAPDQLLSALTRKSLVVLHPEGPGRYSLLGTIRQYAHEKLAAEPDLLRSVREKHLLWCEQLVEHWSALHHGPRHRESIDALDEELGNAHAALDWSVESGQPARAAALAWKLRDVWERRGDVRESYARARRWLSDMPDVVSTARAEGVLAGLGVRNPRGNGGEHARRALEAAQEAGDPLLQAVALQAAPPAERQAAIDAYTAAAELARSAGSLAQERAAVAQLAFQLIWDGQLDAAGHQIRRVAAIAEMLDSAEARGFAAFLSATLARERGDATAARTHGLRSLLLAQDVGDARLQAEAQDYLRDLAIEAQDWALALRHAEPVIPLLRACGRVWDLPFALSSLAYLRVATAEPHDEVWLAEIDEAAAIESRVCPERAAVYLHDRGELLEARGRLDEARSAYEEVLVRWGDDGPISWRAHLSLSRGVDMTEAVARMRRALESATDRAQLAEVAAHAGALAGVVGRQDLAARLLPAAMYLEQRALALRAPIAAQAALAWGSGMPDPPGELTADQLRDLCVEVLTAL